MNASEVRVFPMHAPAKGAFLFVAVLLFILVLTAPLAIYILVRRGSAKIVLTGDRLVATSLGTRQIIFAEVERLGELRVPIVAKGIGGYFARRKVGGNEGINLVVKTRAGKNVVVTVSMYEDYPAVFDAVRALTGREVESVKMGLTGPKWT